MVKKQSEVEIPPDRSHLLTEQRNSRTMNLHELSAAQCVRVLHDEDHAVLEALRQAQPGLIALLEAAEEPFCAGGRLVYLGAGTSGRLGVLDASEAPPTFQVAPGRVVGLIAGGDSALRRSSEGQEDDPGGAQVALDALVLSANDIVLGIAAGGTTPYVLGGLEHAKRCQPRVLTALLSCTPLPRPACADHLIVLPTGPEVLTGSTRLKAGTATKLALNTISTTLMIRAGRVYQNLMVELRATNGKLHDRAARIVMELTGLKRAAAFELLKRAEGDVKLAVLLGQRKLPKAAALALLDRCERRLDRALAAECQPD